MAEGDPVGPRTASNPADLGARQPAQNEQHGCEHSECEKMTTSAQLVQKLWNYCNVLRDDGLSYGDYVEQMTFLLFLKMADEQSGRPTRRPSAVPAGYDWPSLLAKDGDELETHYRHILEKLGKRTGMLGMIFRKAQNKIQDPAKLRRLIVDLIDKEQWTELDQLTSRATPTRGCCRRTPRTSRAAPGSISRLARSSRRWSMSWRRSRDETICDPACGTGGFLLAAHDYIVRAPCARQGRRRDG